ncbi:MAG: Helicase PriA essential for oriC/DnaA-independent DNA replication, partial [uncultured Campylobacterales bacterium]
MMKMIVKRFSGRLNKNYYLVYIIGSASPALTYESGDIFDIGDIATVDFQNKTKQVVICKSTSKPTYDCKELTKTQYFYPKSHIKLFDFISSYYVCNFGKTLSISYPFINTNPKTFETSQKIELNEFQTKAFEFTKKHQTSLVFGNTGSGKTEIYIKAILETLESNKNAILLMPEISLTPQMKKRLKEYFGDSMTIWHSKLTPKKRKESLELIQNGQINLVVGTRSALFLPLQNLGLIVVDEEHDDSYKSNSSPRYNAKDIALYMSKIMNIQVILGSATPSLSSFYKVPYIRLKETFYKSDKTYQFISNDKGISDEILRELKSSVESNKQAIVFTPTRANFKYIICKACDYKVMCPYCEVGMSLHSYHNVLKCHYCTYKEQIPKTCPKCQNEEFMSFRMGTAEIFDILSCEFDNVAKFDKDEITTHKKLVSTLKKFNDKEIDILVGTQMLSKGHDYHDINLAVILGIDYILNMADFRARERALSLVMQVAGRAGRKGSAKVIIQTNNEDFFKQYLGDYELFLKDELLNMKDFYPPYKRFLNILIAEKNIQKAKDIMNEILNHLNRQNKDDIEIVGYGEASISKIASKYRFNILLRSASHRNLLQSIEGIKHLPCQIDMDPVST